MCSVTHVAVGALIGSLVNHHLAAFALGFASHLPLDILPHFDFRDFRVDAALSVGLMGVVLAAGGLSPMLLGAVGSVLPDVENLFWKMKLISEKRKIFPSHSGLIEHGRALGGGALPEAVASALSVAAVVVAVLIRGGTT